MIRKTFVAGSVAATLFLADSIRATSSGLELGFQGLTQNSLPTTNVDVPDVSGAAGLSSFAEFVNGGFAVYSKSNGTEVGSAVTDTQFWRMAGVGSTTLTAGVSNPRMIYDSASGHWFAVEVTNQNLNNNILLAVSSGSSPVATAGNWKAVTIPSNAGASGGSSTYTFAGWPTLGLDASGVYIGTMNSSAGNGSSDDSASLFSIPKSDLLGAAPSIAHMTTFYGSTDNMQTLGFALQPSVSFDKASNPESVFAVNDLSFGEINRTDIAGSGAAGARLSSTQVVTVQDTQFPTSPHQPDGTGDPSPTNGLDPLDDRLGATVYRVGDLIYLAHCIGTPTDNATHAAVRWTVLRVSGTSTSVVDEGTIADPNFDFFQPSISANAEGDVVLAFNRSGLTAPVNAWYAIGQTDASGQISFGSPQQASFSTISDYHNTTSPSLFGQYSSVTPDPSDPSEFWLAQEVPLESGQWATQISEISVPEPGVVISVTLLLLLWVRIRRPSPACPSD